jgi:hypothetical protein
MLARKVIHTHPLSAMPCPLSTHFAAPAKNFIQPVTARRQAAAGGTANGPRRHAQAATARLDLLLDAVF